MGTFFKHSCRDGINRGRKYPTWTHTAVCSHIDLMFIFQSVGLHKDVRNRSATRLERIPSGHRLNFRYPPAPPHTHVDHQGNNEYIHSLFVTIWFLTSLSPQRFHKLHTKSGAASEPVRVLSGGQWGRAGPTYLTQQDLVCDVALWGSLCSRSYRSPEEVFSRCGAVQTAESLDFRLRRSGKNHTCRTSSAPGRSFREGWSLQGRLLYGTAEGPPDKSTLRKVKMHINMQVCVISHTFEPRGAGDPAVP